MSRFLWFTVYIGLLSSAVWSTAECSQSVTEALSVHPSAFYMHMYTTRKKIWHPLGGRWRYLVSNTLRLAATADTVISPARQTTQAALLLLLPTCLSSSSLRTVRMT